MAKWRVRHTNTASGTDIDQGSLGSEKSPYICLGTGRTEQGMR